jgi:hypothetical protein
MQAILQLRHQSHNAQNGANQQSFDKANGFDKKSLKID